MAYTDEELDRAGRRFEELADQIDPETVTVERVDDIREIAELADASEVDEDRPREAVRAALSHDRPWAWIAIALDMTPQAAREWFGAERQSWAVCRRVDTSGAGVRQPGLPGAGL